MSRTRWLAFALGMAVSFRAFGPVANAQEQTAAEPRPETNDEHLAREFFETGRVYFERAEYERAADAFEEAYRRSGRPSLLVNVARSQEAMGRNADAVTTLERALADLPAESELRRTIEARLTRLRAQVAREEAQREAAEAAAADAPASQPVEQSVEPITREHEDSEHGRDDVMWWSGVATVGVGGAALIASIATGVASNSVHSQLEEDCPDGICSPAQADDIDRGEALAVASTVLLVAGVGASVAGALLMWLSLDAGASDEEGVALTTGPGLFGAGLETRF